MGNSICASKVSHLSLVVSAAVTDLVLFLLISGDALISSFDLLLFLYGDGVSRFTAEVEGISLVPAFSCSLGCSSSIKVPPHSGEDSMVTISVFSSLSMALSSSGSTVAASNASLVSPSAVRAALLFSFSTRFSCTSSPNCFAYSLG